MSARPRPTSTIPKAPTSLSPSSAIADAASLTGTHLITLSACSIVHPRAKLVSSFAPVFIGEGNIICEKATIGLLSAGEAEENAEDGITLERDVIVEAAAAVEAARIGRGTVIEVGAKIGKGAVVGKYCRIGPLCSVAPGEKIPDFTVVYGNNERRSEKPGLESLRAQVHVKQIEVLRKLIPSNRSKWQTTS